MTRVTRSIPNDATIGFAITHPVALPSPSVLTMLTITRPTTSSIMAAPIRMVPVRDFCMLAELRMAKVVPKLVEQSAAPAEKAASGVG